MAESRNTPLNRWGFVSRALPVLAAAQTTGAGTAYDLGRSYTAFAIQYKRGTTSATLESTSAAFLLQGNIYPSTSWFTVGAGITINSATPAIARSTNAIPYNRIRGFITSFTTSAGSSGATAQNRIPITVFVSVGGDASS